MRVCIFCGDRADSREHIYADKWPERYPYLKESGGAPQRQIEFDYATNGEVVVKDTGPYDAPPLKEKVRAVYTKCNNGWMSQLETDAEPELRRLFDGESHEITPEHAQLVIRWVAKTSVVLEQTMEKSRRADVSAEQLGDIKNGHIPEHFIVYVYPLAPTGDIFHDFYCRRLVGAQTPDGDPVELPAEFASIIDLSFSIVLIHFKQCLFVCVHSANLWGMGFLQFINIPEILTIAPLSSQKSRQWTGHEGPLPDTHEMTQLDVAILTTFHMAINGQSGVIVAPNSLPIPIGIPPINANGDGSS